MPTAHPHAQRPVRLRSLDALRGLAVAGLLVVLAVGYQTRDAGARAYDSLLPAEWHGWSCADLFAALFVLASGASFAFAGARWPERYDALGVGLRLGRRVLTLLLLGLALNGVDALFHNASSLRLPGVLQRLALVTLAAAPFVLTRARLPLVLSLLAVALLHTALLLWIQVPGGVAGRLLPGEDYGAWLDRNFFGTASLARHDHDPAGIATWLGVFLTFGAGVLAGEYVRRRPLSSGCSARLGIVAAVLIVVGSLLDGALPVNPSLWTPSFALLGAGWALLVFALAYEVADVRGWRFFSSFWVVFGRNALLTTTVALIFYGLLELVPVGSGDDQRSAWTWLHEAAISSDGRLASLMVGLGILLFAWLALYPLHRLRAYLVA